MSIKNINIIKLIRKVNPWKTLYINFHYFPFKTAIKTPIYVYWRTELKELGGNIILPSTIWRGMLHLGVNKVGTLDSFYSRTILELSGTIKVLGTASIGRGSKISVGNNATLTLGKGFMITGNTQIICRKEIVFGEYNLLSWDILIMDSDLHNILDHHNEIVNRPKSIHFGNHVWIGCRTTILKGVTIPDNSIISACSTISRSFESQNCIIGGHGKSGEIIKHDINWKV